MITAADITGFENARTPFYFYDLEALSSNLKRAVDAAGKYGYHVHYALKANADSEILKCVLSHGIGADCVRGAEVLKALEVGFSPSSIAFAGVGKSDEELLLAMKNDIFTINAESLEELEVIEELAGKVGLSANVAIRLNPDVDAKTHHYITTGLEENKFGISGWQIDDTIEFLRSTENVNLKGLHFHIGSQITDLEPFKNLCGRINAAIDRFADAGLRVEHINAGGGLGIDYSSPDEEDDPDFEAFFSLFNELLDLRPHQTLHFELGRSLVARCGDLITKVLYVKKGVKTEFVILDAGMTELIRPALYQSTHPIENLSRRDYSETGRYDVVGPVCESSDCFGKAVEMARTERGDLIAIRSAAAYGESMASGYNLRRLEPTICRKSVTKD